MRVDKRRFRVDDEDAMGRAVFEIFWDRKWKKFAVKGPAGVSRQFSEWGDAYDFAFEHVDE